VLRDQPTSRRRRASGSRHREVGNSCSPAPLHGASVIVRIATPRRTTRRVCGCTKLRSNRGLVWRRVSRRWATAPRRRDSRAGLVRLDWNRRWLNVPSPWYLCDVGERRSANNGPPRYRHCGALTIGDLATLLPAEPSRRRRTGRRAAFWAGANLMIEVCGARGYPCVSPVRSRRPVTRSTVGSAWSHPLTESRVVVGQTQLSRASCGFRALSSGISRPARSWSRAGCVAFGMRCAPRGALTPGGSACTASLQQRPMRKSPRVRTTCMRKDVPATRRRTGLPPSRS
jgi:hypothetical protein